MREYKEMYRYEQYKGTHEFKKGNSRDSQGAWKDGALKDLLGIHATAANSDQL